MLLASSNWTENLIFLMLSLNTVQKKFFLLMNFDWGFEILCLSGVSSETKYHEIPLLTEDGNF